MRQPLIAVSAFLCAAAFAVQECVTEKSADAKAAARYRGTAQAVCRALVDHHMTRLAPDDEISRRAWTNLVESCDADHMVFLASDVAELEKQMLDLDDAFRKGDFSFAFKVRDIYRERLRERVRFATNELACADFEFKGGEFRYKRDGEPWPDGEAARDELWRKRLAAEVLDALAGCETGGVRNAAAALAKSYVDELAAELKRRPDETCEDFVAAVASAYDAHTMYLTQDEYRTFKGGMNLSMCGVGVEWTLKDGGVKIRRVLPGGPIARDGRIKAGDVITGVAPDGDGNVTKTDGLSTREVVALFVGRKGQKITLEVRHSDGRAACYTLVRDEVSMDEEAASSVIVEIDVAGRRMKAGYLRLPSFYASAPAGGGGRSCAEDLRAELEKLNKAGVCGVLFDLRGNNGGSLDDAVKVIGLFVRSGPAVRMRGTGGDTTLPVPANSVVCEVPVLVLTSRASASAGELVPATLQDMGRAVVAGDEHTFGKGTAQTVSEFREGGECAAVVVTDGRFYRVTGASTQFRGVASDILLPSVFDDEFFNGERGLRHPMPWDEIEGCDFEASWDLGRFVPELRRLSAERLAKDPRWKRHMEMVKWAEDRARRTTVPLCLAGRRAQIRRDDVVDDAMEALGERGVDPTNREVDVVLDEGLRILADLVRLNGGRVLPQAKPSAAPNVLLGGLDEDD